jgi:hypothetical protein
MTFFGKTGNAPTKSATYRPKPTITVENPHAPDAYGSSGVMVFWCFMLSTLSGTACLGFAFSVFILDWLPSALGIVELGGFWQVVSYAVSYGGAFALCGMIDFFGIEKFAKYTAFEIALLVSGNSIFTRWRKISLMFWSIVSAVFIAASFALSWYGAAIIAALSSAPDKATVEMVQSTNKTTDTTAYSLELNTLKTLEARRDAELKTVGNSELRKLAKNGNAWAVAELTALENSTRSKYDKQIATATETLRKAKTNADNGQSKTNNMMLSIAETVVDGAKTKAQAKRLFSVLFGVVPLIVGVVLLVITEMGRVVDAVAAEIKASARAEASAGK